jgi:ElaB/YqjD/DUF883 family membrane-anchored ribosome-binding protein
MPTDKQGHSDNPSRGKGEPSRPGSHNGGATSKSGQVVAEETHSATHHVEEESHHLGQQAQRAFQGARDVASHRYHEAENVIAHNPFSSVFVAFGVGVGFGIVLTTLLNQREETWYSRYVPERLRHVPDSLRHLGDSWRAIPEHLSHLPEAVARRLS